ncbi:MAG: hypothetical protein ACREL7_07520 [Longimicrobiales bacterium]
MRVAATVLFALAVAASVQAQDYDLRRSGLPRETARHVRALLDDPATRRFYGMSTLASSETIDGNVAVSDGVLRVAGTIRGELVAVRADVILEPGAMVDGDITVVDGALSGEDAARLAGTVTVFGEGFDLLATAERFHDAPARWTDEDRWDDGDWRGHARLDVRVAQNYNRVEGLPVQIGPDIRTGGAWGSRLEALAVWRTDVGPLTDTRRMGYLARFEQSLGTRAVRIGATARSTVDPIESWSLTNLEASLAASLFHEDQRDYYEREGWSAFARIAPPRTPLDVTFEYRDETHRSLAARDPWTLFNDDHVWRAQPLVAEGDVRLVRASVAWDDRWEPDFRTRGWLAKAELAHVLDGTLSVPATAALAGATHGFAPGLDFTSGYTTGLVDLRRYQPAGPGGIFGMRVVAGGSLDSRALPPQFQHALGGAGGLPGYSLFSADCGARNAFVVRDEDDADSPAAFFPSYGCDRFAMVQFEYRSGMDLHFGHSDDDDDYGWSMDSDVDWTVFFDAGRGWALEQDRIAGRSDTRTLYDAGAGIILGGFGIYGAVPLDREDRGLRLFVRLGPRF